MRRRKQERGQPSPIDRQAQAREDRLDKLSRAVAMQGEVKRREVQRLCALTRRDLNRVTRPAQYLPQTNAWHTGTGTQILTTEASFYGGMLQNTSITTASTMLPAGNYWLYPTGTPISNSGFTNTYYYEYVDPNIEFEREAQEYEDALYQAWIDSGRTQMPDRDVFDLWWQEARKERIRDLYERNKVWTRWASSGFDKYLKPKKLPTYQAPYAGNQAGQERGFVRQVYGIRASGERTLAHLDNGRLYTAEQMERGGYVRQEIVWWRFEVPYETGIPRFVKMDGRPTRGEIRAYDRVVKRQEEIAAAAAAQRALDQAEQTRLRVEAQERASILLRSNLNEQQLRDLEQDNYFDVHLTRADGSPATYRIFGRGQSGNVERLENGLLVERFCIHPYGGQEPDADVWLMQKLMLETDEAEFRRIANITRGPGAGLRIAA